MRTRIALITWTLASCGDARDPKSDSTPPTGTTPTGTTPTGTTPTGTTPTGTTATTVIGVDGGVVASPDASVELVVPAGALTTDVAIEISEVVDPDAAALGAVSSVYAFGPEGLTFDLPVEVHMAYTGEATTMMWTDPTGAYAPIGGEGVDGVWTAEVDHFSRGFVANPKGSTCPGGALFADAPVGYTTVEPWYGGGSGADDELAVGEQGAAPPVDGWGWCISNEADYATHLPAVGPGGLSLTGVPFGGRWYLFGFDSVVTLVSPVIDPQDCTSLTLTLHHEYVQFHQSQGPVSDLTLWAVPASFACMDATNLDAVGVRVWANDDGVLDALDASLERPLDPAVAALGPFRWVFAAEPAYNDESCWSTPGTDCTHSRWEIRSVELTAK